ncbi:MAG: BrnT family toxin [Proteobacteria bacterium]|nr:BrnT family toxin [Pseudomonadota bacterium]
MTFEWDQAKDAANLKKHGISFDEASRIFSGPVLSRIDDRQDYGETREISLGELGGAVVIVVAHTDRNETIRIISARLASRAERKVYYEYRAKITE